MNYVAFEVGKTAPHPFWPSETVDGAKLLQDKDGGVFIVIYLNRPQTSEIKDCQKRNISIGCIEEPGGCSLYLLKFEKSNILLDLSQDPTRYPAEEKEERLKHWKETNLSNVP